MAETVNPYQAPAAPLGTSRETPGALRRDGKILVVTRDAVFPPRCVTCNAPATVTPYPRAFTWSPPAWAGLYAFALLTYVHPAFLASLLIAPIMAQVTKKSAEIEFRMCRRHGRRLDMARRVRSIGLAVFAPLYLFGFACLHPMMAPYRPPWGVIFAIFALTFPWAGFVALANRSLRVKEITDTDVHLTGCGAAFLDSLPRYARPDGRRRTPAGTR